MESGEVDGLILRGAANYGFMKMVYSRISGLMADVPRDDFPEMMVEKTNIHPYWTKPGVCPTLKKSEVFLENSSGGNDP
jgi:hypothetical protein